MPGMKMVATDETLRITNCLLEVVADNLTDILGKLGYSDDLQTADILAERRRIVGDARLYRQDIFPVFFDGATFGSSGRIEAIEALNDYDFDEDEQDVIDSICEAAEQLQAIIALRVWPSRQKSTTLNMLEACISLAYKSLARDGVWHGPIDADRDEGEA